jgi:hypothetical protein
MAEITNPEAIRFVNEQIRPMAETLRDLNTLLDNLYDQWVNAQNPLGEHFSSPADTVEDGREQQGASRLTAGDITGFAAELNTMIQHLDEAGVLDRILKPCYRQLIVIGSGP